MIPNGFWLSFVNFHFSTCRKFTLCPFREGISQNSKFVMYENMTYERTRGIWVCNCIKLVHWRIARSLATSNANLCKSMGLKVPYARQFPLEIAKTTKTCKMQEVRNFTLGIVSGHQLEDMQTVWPPGMQCFAYSIGGKKQFLPPKKSIFSFLT